MAAGKRRDAILMLRARVDADPASTENRRAFAQFYREIGHPDQAGRWGLLVDDFVTAVEREAFVSLLRNTDPTSFRARTLLVLDKESELPAVVLQAIDDAHKPPVVIEAQAESSWDAAMAIVVFVAWAFVFLLPLVIFGLAAFGVPWIQTAALGGLAIAVGLFALVGVVALLGALVKKSRRIP